MVAPRFAFASSCTAPLLRPRTSTFAGSSVGSVRGTSRVAVTDNVGRRCRTVTMQQTSGKTPRWLVGVGLLVIVAALASPTFLPLLNQGSGQGLSDVEISRRLRPVPLFSVTDASGKPFLNDLGQDRIGYFFFDPKDAESFLDKVKEVNGATIDARIFPISLDEAYKLVKRRQGDDVFKLMAKEAEVIEAKRLTQERFNGTVPLFYIDGLAFASDNGEGTAIPLFFNKEDLEATISRLKRENPQIADKVCSPLEIE